MSIKQNKINVCSNLVRMSNRKIGKVRSSDGEGDAHRLMKELICDDLKSKGKAFITEAIFNTGGRADILVLEDFKAIEIVSSEKEESIVRKSKLYPSGIEIEVVNCGD